MTAERVVGVVDFVGKDKHGAPFARLVPVYDIGNGTWRQIKPGEFPREDRVFWPSAREAVDHGVFSFHLESNSGQKDEFRAADLEPLTEVLDVRASGDAESARLALLSGRLRPPPTRVLLWCSNSEIVGPIKCRIDDGGELKLDVPNKDRIPLYSADRLDIRPLLAPRTQRFVLAGVLPSPPDSYVDWDEDRLVVRRAVAWVVDRAKRVANAPPLVKRQIDEIAEAVAKSAADCESGLERYRLERARKLFQSRASGEELAAEAAKELAGLPELESALQTVRDHVRSEAKADLATQLHAERDAMRKLQEERAALGEELATLQQAIAAARAAADAQVRDVEKEVERRVREVVSRPSTLLAEVAVLRCALSAPAVSTPPRAADAQRIVRWPKPQRRINDLLELRKNLTAAFKASGVAPPAALRIHAAVVAGLVPVVCGPRAVAALDAYTRVVCGQRSLTIHANPGLLEATDVLGKLDAASGVLVPHPAGLLSTFEAARGEDGLALVTIEGMNRGATECYLLPLLQCISDGAPLRLSAVRGEESAVISPPPNIRLAGTVVEAPTSLPVCRQLWAYAVLIEAESCPKEGPRPDFSDVPLGSDLLRPCPTAPAVVDEFMETLPEARDYRETLRQYGSALASMEKDEHRLSTALIDSILLPVAVSLQDEEERTEAITAIERLRGATDRGALGIAVKRIRRRIA